MTQSGPSSPATQESDAATSAYRPGYEVVAERILEYVVREGLEPGARLPTEKDLATELGASRTVVREAVKVLSALGRLSVEKGRGIYVASPKSHAWEAMFSRFLPADPQRVYELFEFRRFVETTTTRLAATRATPVQVRAVHEAAQRTVEAAASHDIEAFSRADEAFHAAIAAAASNVFFSGMVDSIQKLHRQVTTVGLAGTAAGSLPAAAEQHRAIAEAVAAGEAEQATALMAAHIDMTLEQLQREIRNVIFRADTDAGA
ncbi:FadR/GntR family transcriptional regulator [Streptomyces tubercidicus]|uniref:FadR/GntR family transcriptional regulator n=1 Tax=Streptomyces tubercidicus TaxID=47759 RepID=UPI0034659493